MTQQPLLGAVHNCWSLRNNCLGLRKSAFLVCSVCFCVEAVAWQRKMNTQSGSLSRIVFGLYCKRLVDSAELKLCRTSRSSHSIDFNHTWPPGVADTDERAIMGAKSITEGSSCSSSLEYFQTLAICDVICRHHQSYRSRKCWVLSNFLFLWQNCCSVENKLLDKLQPSSQMWLVRPFRSIKSSISCWSCFNSHL